ncbi:hypothetical protein DL95DRAFT_451416 [Leptodontidium sp. 2 PMI_412]|nr:hypothetical protein BKA61DRAFT_663350 [Leptodontidium sp. MPI-SDFR-AT-0119]KAH9205041.1 hypothetical protein DL95DRAFT_451416 [Leptodontidium sp. 2 PMI_412]
MDGNLQWYKDIRSPPWYCRQDTQPDPAKLPVNQILCTDVKGRFDNPLLFSSGHISFADYPHYEKRLREMKHYMDFQAPAGLRGLWRDKRNLYSFYTLWLVVIFGGVCNLLALASLVVSALQLWAAIHPPGN